MIKSLQSYRESIGFLRKHGLSWFLWFPLLITILVFYLGFGLTSLATDTVTDLVNIWLDKLELPEWTGFFGDVFYWLLWLLFRILLYFAFAFLGGSVILLLMAPVLTWLSERVALALNKQVYPFTTTRFINDLMRALTLAVKNGLIQLAMTIVCFLISFIPVIGAVAPLLLFVINAFYYGYNFMDYTLERKQLTVNESNAFVWKNKSTTLALGTPFTLWMLIPFIGPLSAGFIAIFATVAATINLERGNHLPFR
ncbi:MAG: EI24 domain-containing protein [Salibacteraceae bacterium]